MRFARPILALLALTASACFQADANDDEAGGLRCEDYCSTIADACTDLDEQYPTDLACMNMCEHLTLGQSGDAQGNTLGCRMTWSIEALEKSGDELSQNCRWTGP